jgi:hypothetical protein
MRQRSDQGGRLHVESEGESAQPERIEEIAIADRRTGRPRLERYAGAESIVSVRTDLMSAVSSVSRVAVLKLYLLSGSAFAKTLPLPENLISLTS